jgi:hypothetical protein
MEGQSPANPSLPEFPANNACAETAGLALSGAAVYECQGSNRVAAEQRRDPGRAESEWSSGYPENALWVK